MSIAKDTPTINYTKIPH